MTIPQARSLYASGVQVVATASHFSGRKLKEFETLLNGYKIGGQLPVKVLYKREDAEAVLTLGDSWRVQASDELLIALMERFGHESVSLSY
jgi:DNA polymerase-3 subunit alpha